MKVVARGRCVWTKDNKSISFWGSTSGNGGDLPLSECRTARNTVLCPVFSPDSSTKLQLHLSPAETTYATLSLCISRDALFDCSRGIARPGRQAESWRDGFHGSNDRRRDQ